MAIQSSIITARQMIERFGLQAQAVAAERATLAQHDDPRMQNHWEQVHAVICDLRRSAAAKERRQTHA
ncbi:MAG TPA: hypothetical protein VL752_11170 [Acidisoma sp.]|jgi:hypothetical protein|uniref:hypothetical protein n=1 Tax=Acidisoma sp. TaxID=1872115 RepID=UPI002D1BA0E3|nr:hypothetical protein [Acidisoma sp.]HTI01496.1 hypothetical protein [Acidisoma sp.]